MANYQVKIRNRLERETVIADAVKTSDEKHTLYEYQNKRNELPIVRVDVNLPIYRMSNFRTCTVQLKHIRERRVADDFFSSGQENDSAQDAQHKILVEFAERGRASSVVPIMNQLEEEEQREPLLITHLGVVVNGNRRLAAMRELLLREPGRFMNFSHVDCAVLPRNITPEEILEIEVRLQMRAETRLPYGWIEESIAIREMLRAGKKPTYVANLMKKKPKEVATAERALTEADIYLKEWIRDPNRYELVEDAQQAFNDLAKAVNGVEGEMLEVKRRFAWTLVSMDPEKLDGRLYGYNFSFDNRTDEVIAGLSDRLSIDFAPVSSQHQSDEEEGIDVDLDDEGDGSETSLENLIEIFDNPDPVQRETIAEDLIEVCNSIRERARLRNVGNQALNAITAANTKLMSADLSKADPGTYESIHTQLVAVRVRAESMEKALLRYTSSNPTMNDNADE